ncbi:DegT/DnrJ/EryC1/StrS family aminotransferase [Daejeonella sp.]|uniref:DegT/DnrJ/EryC1/StrS family aminotransferase n=1 Tax=Daejeonella sp. TaxID=2805397 RepID=UPI002B57D41C|nr:DegT/DnrJ/EryC1/StrS family aminotransferase [Daejeonella sp.]HQT58836.1 DegT/DnrJ/EryC1/StrS family aminotransferase [Daejeonella sp.]
MIRLSKSCLSADEKKAVMDVLDHEYLGMGADVQKFEEALSAFFGRTAVCVSNGTAAVQLAIQACGIGPGDEVLVPSLTYLATFQAISATGAVPIACEVEEHSCLLDCKDAEKRLTKRTKAIMPVHYSGGVNNIDEIYAFATKHNLRVIEDAAHAFGTIHNAKKVGGFGDIACFSFDGIKNITSGEGGCVVTDDKSVLSIIRDARLLGIEKDTEKRFSGQRSWEFDVKIQGWRYHMSNIMAAIGLVQLHRFDGLAVKRQQLAKRYDELLSDVSNIKLLDRDYSKVVPHIYIIRLNSQFDKKELQANLLELGIQTGIHYLPNHLLSFYKNDKQLPFPVTEKLYLELLTLPLHPDIGLDDVEFVCANLIRLLSEKK